MKAKDLKRKRKIQDKKNADKNSYRSFLKVAPILAMAQDNSNEAI